MKQQQVMEKIETTWNEFVMAYSGLSDSQFEQPGVTESWSAKDLIAHVSWWEEEFVEASSPYSTRLTHPALFSPVWRHSCLHAPMTESETEHTTF